MFWPPSKLSCAFRGLYETELSQWPKKDLHNIREVVFTYGWSVYVDVLIILTVGKKYI